MWAYYQGETLKQNRTEPKQQQQKMAKTVNLATLD